MHRKLVKTARPKEKQVNFLLLDGGVGDHIASLVVLDYIYKKYTYIIPLIWVPNYLVDSAKHILPDKSYIKSFSEMKKYYNPNITTKTTKWDGITSAMKIHLLDYAFFKLCDENPDITHKNYLKLNLDSINTIEFILPDKYVVLTTGYTAKAREFPAKHVNKIVEYIKSKGYAPVFLGQTKTETGGKHIIEGNFDKNLDLSKGINLVNKTTLLQAGKVMGNAKAVIGVDNGLLHVAGCTDTAIIGGFTSVSPEIRMPVRNNILGWNYYPVVPDKKSGCLTCQEKTNFLYGHDYRGCIFADNKCVDEMSADKFIAQLERIL